MSSLPWIVGGGVIAAYLYRHATQPQLTNPLVPLATSSSTARVAVTAPRNARRKGDHPDLVSVVAHARAWPGTSLRAR